MKKPYTVRLDESLLNDIQDIAEQRGETVTSIFEQALKSFLSDPNNEADIGNLLKRVERLEATLIPGEPKKKQRSASKKGNTEPEPISPDDVGELVTLDQASALTRYSKGTLSPKFSKVGIKAVDRVDGNRAGLYSKAEILDKIGMKE